MIYNRQTYTDPQEWDEDTLVNEYVGYRLRRCREIAHLSVKEVARRIGYTPNNLYAIERGETAVGLEKLEVLCDMYKADTLDIVKPPWKRSMNYRIQELQFKLRTALDALEDLKHYLADGSLEVVDTSD